MDGLKNPPTKGVRQGDNISPKLNCTRTRNPEVLIRDTSRHIEECYGNS